MATYNITRFTRQVLKRYRKEPPSVVVHLHPTHFRLGHQVGNFAYDSPMRCFLDAIREQKLPTDLLGVLDRAGVRYYDGCLIVEIHDHRSSAAAPARPQPASRPRFSFQNPQNAREPAAQAKAEVYRIVLAPSTGTLWHELGILNATWNDRQAAAASTSRLNSSGGPSTQVSTEAGWTEEQAVELEAEILVRTQPPLCLDPSTQVSRIANTMLRATTMMPPSKKRKADTSAETPAQEEDAEEVARREREERTRMMKIGDEGVGRSRANGFARLTFIQHFRDNAKAQASARNIPVPGSTGSSTPAGSGNGNNNLAKSIPVGASTAGSPPADDLSASQAGKKGARNKKKKVSLANSNGVGGGGDSDGSASNISSVGPKKPSKKALAAAAAQGINITASTSASAGSPGGPVAPMTEEQRAAAEKKRRAQAEKRAANKAKKDKEKRAKELQAQQLALQQQIAAAGGPNPFTASYGAPQRPAGGPGASVGPGGSPQDLQTGFGGWS